jgi:hypothetical protein
VRGLVREWRDLRADGFSYRRSVRWLAGAYVNGLDDRLWLVGQRWLVFFRVRGQK